MRIWYLALGLALAATGALAQSRPAVLTVEGDMVCTLPISADHQVSTDHFNLDLPEISGPVSATGRYVDNGTGYVLAGAAKVAGEVKDDAELVLTYRQWEYNGKWLFSDAPYVPTAGAPVIVPLEPGGSVVVPIDADGPEPGIHCTGQVVYRIDFERETQVWDIALEARRTVRYRNLYGLRDSETGVWSSFDYIHGVTFRYALGARVTLEKRKGLWNYRDGQVTEAGVTFSYKQAPELYTVLAISCDGCGKVAALKGQALDGTSDGSKLKLRWTNVQPVVHIDSRFAAACAPGPRQASCERLKKDGSRFSAEDDDTLQRMPGHKLPLRDGPYSVITGSTGGASALDLDYGYTLTRVK